jgi:hypothetical protein
LRFGRFLQRKHPINVQTEPSFTNAPDHIAHATQQLFPRAHEIVEPAA